MEVLVHTGQHFDRNMSQLFFDELSIPRPDHELGIVEQRHGVQTGRMLAAIEDVLLSEKPDWVVVYGDTNSTLAAALAACKLGIPIAHVEAGLRSFNRTMPEEHNRVLTDHCSDLLLCPTQSAVEQLAREGITSGVHHAGDPMREALLNFLPVAEEKSTALEDLGVEPGAYVLATLHRPYNVDQPETLIPILEGLRDCGSTVVLPMHPRTRARVDGLLEEGKVDLEGGNLHLIEPIGYLDMLKLESSASVVVTDSGGVQKEAFFLRVPCVTVRPETEWIETVELGWNVLVAPTSAEIQAAITSPPRGRTDVDPFGPPDATRAIAELLVNSTPH